MAVNYKDLGLVNTREMFKRAVDGGYADPPQLDPHRDLDRHRSCDLDHRDRGGGKTVKEAEERRRGRPLRQTRESRGGLRQ